MHSLSGEHGDDRRHGRDRQRDHRQDEQPPPVPLSLERTLEFVALDADPRDQELTGELAQLDVVPSLTADQPRFGVQSLDRRLEQVRRDVGLIVVGTPHKVLEGDDVARTARGDQLHQHGQRRLLQVRREHLDCAV